MNNIENKKAVLEKKKFNKTAFFLSISFFPLALILLPTIKNINNIFNGRNTIDEDLLILITVSIITLIYVIVFFKYRNSSIELYIPKHSLKVLIFKGILLGISFIVLNYIISIIFQNIFGIELISNNTEEIAKKIQSVPYFLIIQTVIIAPIIEELQFKAGIFTLFSEFFYDKHKVLNTIIPAIIASFIFSYMHDKFSLVFIKYFVSSYISCLVYKKNHSLIPCIVAHLFNNLLATILLLF